jgi:hypothetical protein
MAAFAAAASLAGSGMQAYGSIMQGREQSRAAQMEADNLRIQQAQYSIAAAKDEAKRRNDLTSSLEAIQAIRAGRNVGAGSPTGLAILDSAIEDSNRDVSSAKLNYATRSDLAGRAALLSDRKAYTSILAGNLAAGEAIAGGLSKSYMIGSGQYPTSARVG